MHVAWIFFIGFVIAIIGAGMFYGVGHEHTDEEESEFKADLRPIVFSMECMLLVASVLTIVNILGDRGADRPPVVRAHVWTILLVGVIVISLLVGLALLIGRDPYVTLPSPAIGIFLLAAIGVYSSEVIAISPGRGHYARALMPLYMTYAAWATIGVVGMYEHGSWLGDNEMLYIWKYILFLPTLALVVLARNRLMITMRWPPGDAPYGLDFWFAFLLVLTVIDVAYVMRPIAIL